MFTKTIPGRSAPKVLNPTKKTKTTKKAAAAAPSTKKTKTAAKAPSKRMKQDAPEARYRKKAKDEPVVTRAGARMPRAADQVHGLNRSSTDSVSNSGISTPVSAEPAVSEEERLKKYRFEIGTKYMMDADTPSPCIYTVKNAYQDSTMEFRKVWSLENGLEVLDLSALMRDKYEPGFRMMG